MFRFLFPKHKRSENWPSYFAQSALTATQPLIQGFYQHSLPDANTPISELQFIAIDLETTGLNYASDEIISIGTVTFDWQSIFLNSAQYSLVKPRTFTQASGSTIHQITHSDLIDAPNLTEVLTKFIPTLSGHVVVAHFCKIEREFLRLAAKRCFDHEWLFPMIDTMALEKTIQQKRRSSAKHSLRLHQVRTRYQLPTYQGHHALTDAIACAELFQAQIAHQDLANCPICDLWR